MWHMALDKQADPNSKILCRAPDEDDQLPPDE